MVAPILSSNKVLIPISVDNPAFSTTMMVQALSAIEKKYDEFIFFIADDLQLYNKATNVQNGTDLTHVIETFQNRKAYLQEKTNWLEKVRRQLRDDIKNAKWTFTNIESYSDERLHDIMRNVFLLYKTIPQFHDDVIESAREFYTRTKGAYSEKEIGLSKFYILEEIAINIRIRVLCGIRDEYYAFSYPKPMLKIYSGSYGISAFALAGVPDATADFSFYKFVNNHSAHWIKLAASDFS